MNKCPNCGYELPDAEEQIKKFNEAVNKAVEEKLDSLKKAAILKAEEIHNKKESDLKQQIAKLEGDIKNAETAKKLAVEESIKSHNQTISDLKHQLELDKTKYNGELKEALDKLDKSKQTEIDNLKAQLDKATDYKLKMNVKDLGEDLEQYCENKFNAIRANTYPNAYFEKDSDTKVNNEKGDYIFRDYVGEGEEKTEFISIMFDMKNEDDTAKTKHKNEDYFKKLDSDRKAKGCEYAVLVSMLEIDNDLYNQGIVDVSYKYPKMFVVRPQHFLTIIALLRSAALSNAKDKLEIVKYQQQNLDVANFEQELSSWKANWGKNIEGARKHFESTIAAIDASIKNMQKIRDELTGTVKQLGYADNKVEELTLRKLSKNSPSIKEALKKKN